MKIYDCFTFFNELDLLEIRLNILDAKVDRFVLVEATTTFTGQKKELNFEKNKSQFEKFLPKITYVVVNDMPKVENGNAWALERFQRDAIMRGLSNCSDEDIVIISDLDEIPNLEKIKEIKSLLIKNKDKNDTLYNLYNTVKRFFINLKTNIGPIVFARKVFNYFGVKSNRCVMFKQNIYYYYFNGFIHDHWFGSRAVLYKNLITEYKSSPQQIRNTGSKIVIEKGGWHFSYLATPEDIAKKIQSFSHSEYNTPDYTDINLIKERIAKGNWLFGKEFKITYIPMDKSYPSFILENMKKYDLYIHHNNQKV